MPVRGDILIADKYANQPYHVATNVMKYTLYADDTQIQNQDEVAQKISEVLQIDKQEIASKIADKKRSYVVLEKPITDDQAEILAADISNRIQTEMTYPGQIKVTVIRETRSVSYAK